LDDTISQRSVGLLVVHGIGSQTPGATLQSCAEAMMMAYRDAHLFDESRKNISVLDIGTRQLKCAIIKQSGLEVRMYEVYWADLLAGRRVAASFSKYLLDGSTWFPLLSWKNGTLAPPEYSKSTLWYRTLQLVLFQVASSIILELAPKFIQSSILDEIVADVWNYAESLGGAVPESSPIYGAGQQVVDRFRAAAQRAVSDGCDELQIVAHSLGTVIAYNGLTRYPSSNVKKAGTPITRLYTIGSPIEKFLFIWTRLMRPAVALPEITLEGRTIATAETIRWNNYYSPLDLVSGRLRRFTEWGNIQNRRLIGLGGLLGAHVSYFRHPVVINELAAGLGGRPQTITIPWYSLCWRTMVAIVETLLFPAAIFLALMLGVVVLVVFFGIFGAVVAALFYPFYGPLSNLVLSWFGYRWTFLDFVGGYALVCAALATPAIVLFTIKDGYKRAKADYDRYWRIATLP
jgi:hypothetical protein